MFWKKPIGHSASLSSADVQSLLQRALHAHDAEAVEDALVAAESISCQPELVPLLIKLLESPWHYKHEDIVRLFQKWKVPESVEALYGAALVEYEYLKFDENFGLARKCTWALADIGTPGAYEKLQLLTAHDNSIIAYHAQQRIDNWEKERARKGG